MDPSAPHPYSALESRAFWAQAVAGTPTPFDGLWRPKFPLKRRARIATFGSCFAQHFARALADRGLNWVNAEPAPDGLSAANITRFNYHAFSARTGAIYTAAMLHQWCRWALGGIPMPAEWWSHNDRAIDPMRPHIEPGGFASDAELQTSRRTVLTAFARAVKNADVFVFTLGLTEAWMNGAERYEYAICPGIVAGRFDPSAHHFVNHTVPDVVADLGAAIALMRTANPALQVLLTVSPIPLTATASGDHVLLATARSKAVLRAAAAQVRETHSAVDYVPAFEIVTAHATAGPFYEPNRRTVAKAGVDAVMATVFDALGVDPLPHVLGPREEPHAGARLALDPPDPACVEQLLATFGPGRGC